MKYQILWQANPISCMKTFGKLNCTLCMRERVEILQAYQQEKTKLINSKMEIFGACHHKTTFHRFLKENRTVKSSSTDDGICQKRVYGGGKSRVHPGRRALVHLEGEVTVCVPVHTVPV